MIGMTVCSGIGAPEVSAPWIDWRYQSEIEKFPCAVLAHRFPEATNLGDMTKFEEWPDATVDVLCGGTPCQSFSVAGLRKGLDDPRGNLMLTYLAIARRYRPRWVVWENVPGVLSSNGGRDFGSFLGGLGELGYGFSYRVLDAYDLGAPLTRPRVFVVGYFGGWTTATSVLFDREDFGHASPRSRTGSRGHTLSAQNAGCRNGRGNAVCVHGLLRALTPLETERCLGFPDGWTAIPECALQRVRKQSRGRKNSSEKAAEVRPAGFVQRVLSKTPQQAQECGSDTSHAQKVEYCDTLRPDDQGCRSHDGKSGRGLCDMQDTASRAISHRSLPHNRTRPRPSMPRLQPEAANRRGREASGCGTRVSGQIVADGPRYRALGNSWAVNCGSWIFDRIRMVEEMP